MVPDWLEPHLEVWRVLLADHKNFVEAQYFKYQPLVHRDRYRNYDLVVRELAKASGCEEGKVRGALLSLVEHGVMLYKHSVGIRWGVKNPPTYGT